MIKILWFRKMAVKSVIVITVAVLSVGWNASVVLAATTTNSDSGNKQSSSSQTTSTKSPTDDTTTAPTAKTNNSTSSNSSVNQPTTEAGPTSSTSSSIGSNPKPQVSSTTSNTTNSNSPVSSDNTNTSSTNASSNAGSTTSSTQTATGSDSKVARNTTSTKNKQGPTSPTGPAANTFTYNATTGMWENQYYIWNPNTGQTTPRTPQSYSYNPKTGMWDTTNWVYDPTSQSYVPNVISTVAPPVANSLIINGQPANQPNNNVSSVSNNNGTFNNFYNAAISNNLYSTAQSGDASVVGNTQGGNATSGNAQALANIINVLQSTSPMTEGNVDSFVSNLYGNIQGNLLIDPSVLLQNLNGNTNSSQTTNNNLTVNSDNNGQINNNVTLAAQSGNATVSQNTSAGNATSGNATAIANILNLVNSMIGASKSFVGTINVYGDLSGNIEIPAQYLQQIIGTNAPNSTSTSNSSINNNINANTTNNTTINNNLNTSATSGEASVSNNTNAGNASTGNATTNVTVLNLTGNQVVGADTLLVFVNVLGKWVGLMVNAPSGSTAAAYGGSLTQNNQINNNANLTSTNNNNITNNINASSNSGNASVTDNTTAGNATTGNAYTAVNLGNLVNDNFNLSSWFGVLFINIFGNWMGSLGAVTPAVNTSGGGSNLSSNSPSPSTSKTPQVFSFVPTSVPKQTIYASAFNGFGNINANSNNELPINNSKAVVYGIANPPSQLVSAIEKLDPTIASATKNVSNNNDNGYNYAAIGLVSGGLVLLLTERYISIKRRQSSR